MLTQIRSALYGVAVGDAMGAPLEFMSREEIRVKYGRQTEMIGGGRLGLKPGEFTDDTQMTLAVARGLTLDPHKPVPAIGRFFMEWFDTGPKDIGNTTRASLVNFRQAGDWRKAAELTRQQLNSRVAGNGALMRTIPITLAYFREPDKIETISRQVTAMTHPGPDTELASMFYNTYVYGLLQGKDKKRIYAESVKDFQMRHRLLPEDDFMKLLLKAPDLDFNELKASAFVLDTLTVALCVFLRGKSFEEIVIEAVNLGDDSDTIGAVTGGLAGVYYGYDAIPARWLETLQGKEELEKAARGLERLTGRRSHSQKY